MSDEWAKTAGKGIDAGRELGQFLAPIVRAPLENAMGIVADKLAYMRWERQERLILKAREFMLEQGLSQPTRAVPMNVAIPLMQAASMEEDDVLQDTWARLLVNAMDADSGVEVRRSFVSILEQFSPLDVRIMALLYDASRDCLHQYQMTSNLPERLGWDNSGKVPIDKQPYDKAAQLSLWNLARLGCVTPGEVYYQRNVMTGVMFTSLGEAIVEACTLKPKS